MGNERKLGWKQTSLDFSLPLTIHPGEQLYLFFTKKVENGVISQTKYETQLKSTKKTGCNVAACKVNIYYSLQKILKYIPQNLQHGSIF
jgi:hypothetical protein